VTTATTRQPISSQCSHPENKMCAYIRAASFYQRLAINVSLPVSQLFDKFEH